MRVREGLADGKLRFPVFIKPRDKEYPFKVPGGYWLFLFAITGFTFYASMQSFFSSGRIWPPTVILLILLLLLHLWLDTKQCLECESTYKSN